MLCVAGFPCFPSPARQQSCQTRKQIIIKATERSSDNTKEHHWHINTVPGHHVITVYRPTAAQLPPLQSSLITTLSHAEAGTLTVRVTSYHLTADFLLRCCLFKFGIPVSHESSITLVFQVKHKSAVALLISSKAPVTTQRVFVMLLNSFWIKEEVDSKK